MHNRISINTLSLAPAPLSSLVDTVARIGAIGISPDLEQLKEAGIPASIKLLRDSGLTVATLTHRSFGFATEAATDAARDRLIQTIDVAAQAGARSIIMTTGGRGGLTWAEAADRFSAAVAPCVEIAKSAGVCLGIEPTSHLYSDASIAHRMTDTVAIASKAGISVMMDFFGCWFDSDIDDAIKAAAPMSPLVQVSDYVYGDRALPCRAVPGDGAVPWGHLVPAIIDAGFDGWFDLEIIGPRLQAEGQETGLIRAANVIGRFLDKSRFGE
jgi:sugar phosphate isomerase/epimerase